MTAYISDMEHVCDKMPKGETGRIQINRIDGKWHDLSWARTKIKDTPVITHCPFCGVLLPVINYVEACDIPMTDACVLGAGVLKGMPIDNFDGEIFLKCGDCQHWKPHNCRKGLCDAKLDDDKRRIYTSKNSTCYKVQYTWFRKDTKPEDKQDG